jgi:hypothetical protein
MSELLTMNVMRENTPVAGVAESGSFFCFVVVDK